MAVEFILLPENGKKKKIPVYVPLFYKSSLKKILQKHKLHFGDGGGSWLDVYSGQQGYLSSCFTLHIYRRNFGGNSFYTESFWLELLVFMINWMNLDLYGWYTNFKKKYPKKNLVNVLFVEETRVTFDAH